MEEIEEIIDSIIECNKKDYSQVINIILSIQTIIKKHTNEFSIHQATLNKHATPFLISMLSKAPTDTPDIDEFLHTISSTISSLCGRIASTTNTNKFEFKSGPLTLHESNFSDADINEAIEKSYSNEFIDKLEEKLEYKAGIKGSRLSGGQKQRIAMQELYWENHEY